MAIDVERNTEPARNNFFCLFLQLHYANTSMLYTTIFQGCKNDNFQMKNIDIFPIFTLSEAVLTSTHNLCFRAKIRKNVYPCKPHFYYIKMGCKGVKITGTC